jgi:hypothetical protein
MNNRILYGDLWALLRKLGFDVGTLDQQNHRVCEFVPNDTRIVLHDYPPDHPVRAEILFGVRLQLDNGGIMSPAKFDRWAARRTKPKKAVASNGVLPKGKTRKA